MILKLAVKNKRRDFLDKLVINLDCRWIVSSNELFGFSKSVSFSLDNIESGIYFISIIESGNVLGHIKFISLN